MYSVFSPYNIHVHVHVHVIYILFVHVHVYTYSVFSPYNIHVRTYSLYTTYLCSVYTCSVYTYSAYSAYSPYQIHVYHKFPYVIWENFCTDSWAVPTCILVNAEHYGRAGVNPRVVKPQQQAHTIYTLIHLLYSPRFLAALPAITFATSLFAAAITSEDRVWERGPFGSGRLSLGCWQLLLYSSSTRPQLVLNWAHFASHFAYCHFAY